ncbi:MAG: arsenate reductase (azurin) large subunit [Trueperaceae bacterium]|nr:arsenate reductase (azurin) large subunit [Trueperaceae bacterium]
MALYDRQDELPIPPKGTEKRNTVCQYCNVGCGYEVYTWPVGTVGGKAPSDNAFGIDLSAPQPPLQGLAYTESMHSVVTNRDGRRYHVVIVPTKDSAINLQGDHSSRGGSNAQTLFSESRGTQERLKYPLLRVGDDFHAITWDEALRLLGRVIKGVHGRYGPDELTAKAADHGGANGGFANIYAVGRLFFTGLGMKYVAMHNRPAYNSEVWGSRDRGVHELHYTAEDARLCDTLVLWGANSYETSTVFYTEHMQPNFQGGTQSEKREVFDDGEPVIPTRLVVVDPRRTSTLTILEAIDPSRTLHLRPNLGTDYVLANAVARVIWERGWQDQEMIDTRTDAATFEDYQEKSLQLGKPLDELLGEAEEITGVPRAQIEQAAEWIAAPKEGGFRNRTLNIYEKGMIWNYKNYDTIAALVQMEVLAGNIGRPGTGCGRQGGHQESYVRPPYPGGRPPPNVDKYLLDGNGKFYWVIANNPYLSTPNNQLFRKRIHERTLALTSFLSILDESAGEPSSMDELADRVLQGVEQTGGLFMVVQDIYQTEVARDAHLVLPAACWGEIDMTSVNCNSRLLRLYEKFMDPPGEAIADWDIMARTGRQLAELYEAEGDGESAQRFAGMEWQSDEDVFLAGGQEFESNEVPADMEASLHPFNYKGVDYAMLRELGQQGIQTPIRRDPQSGELVGTKRRYTERFGTESGLFEWYGTDAWPGFPAEVQKYLEGDKAERYPFWMTTGRNQTIWQSAYHQRHNPEKMLTVPLPYVELHPDDADRLSIESGDMVSLFNEEGNGTFVAYVTEAARPGMVFAIQYHPGGTSNGMVSPYTDPKTTIPWYKGARVAVRRLEGTIGSVKRTTSFRSQIDFS